MKSPCLSCEIVAGRRECPGGPILETDHFHIHQDIAYPVPGQVIVAAKRHFRILTEMSLSETAELLPLLQKVRSAQQSVLAIKHVYYFYNEDTNHHFHVWMVPRHSWMGQFGKSIEAVRPALVHARDNMNSSDEIRAVEATTARIRDELIKLAQ